MFFKERKSIKVLDQNIYKLQEEILGLKAKIKQLQCSHTFRFKRIGWRDLLVFECPECGQIKYVPWSRLPEEEQRAYRLLNMIPDDWPDNL